MAFLAAVLCPQAAGSAAAGPAADSLSLHERTRIQILVATRAGCADCSAAPDFRTARWRFASDYRVRGAVADGTAAYVTVTVTSFGGDRRRYLLGYDPHRNGWRMLAVFAPGPVECDRRVLVAPGTFVRKQLAVLERIQPCAP